LDHVAKVLTDGSQGRRAAERIVLLCFLGSGMSGLIYQVIWVRQLVLVFGATTFAASTVLTAFMGGLAIGSYYSGRRCETYARPLRLYGLLEIGIGLYGMAVPLIFAVLPRVYEPIWLRLHLSFLALTIIRFALATLVLIVPTALMGATLPVLSLFYARDHRLVGLRVGWLYSINTFGAVIGAAASGFILIPAVGMHATTTIAAAMNVLLGVVALATDRSARSSIVHSGHNGPAPAVDERGGLFGRLRQRPSPSDKQASSAGPAIRVPNNPTRLGTNIALAAFAASGFVALSYEVIWSRVLALIIGSSVYAFSIMLATFLIGLAAGASLVSRAVDRMKNPAVFFGLIEIGIGVSSLIGAYCFNQLPYVFIGLYRWLGSSNMAVLLLVRFLVASMVMIVPTLLMGALFPLVVRIVHARPGGIAPAPDRDASAPGQSGPTSSASRTVGQVYSVNTVGAIAGAFASGFILVPWLGLLDSLRLCVAINFVIAGGLFLGLRQVSGEADARRRDSIPRKSGKRDTRAKQEAMPGRFTRRLALAAAGFLLLATGVLKPTWDVAVMSSGVYRYAPSISKLNRREFFDYFASGGQGETIFYKEGITATVVVQRQNGGRVLKVNGKPDASTAGDLPTQVLIGSMPLLVREKTDDVLLIGLGSGVTLGSVEQFPVKHVTCVELEPAVIEASHFFDDVNHRSLDDPRLKLVANDGRNFIDTTDERYDAIISEPSNPWLTGVANLFTLEYFKRGAEKLKDDGVFSQWLQIYEMPPEDVKTLIATFQAVFPRVYLFRGAEGDLMLLGSKRQLPLDLGIIRSHLADPRVAADLGRVHVNSAADFVSRFYLGPAELSRLAAGAQLNTDDNALIEFSAPRRVGIDEETIARNLKTLLALAASPVPYLGGDFIEDPEGAPEAVFAPAAHFESHGAADFLLDAALGAIKRDDLDRAEQFAGYSIELGETARAHAIMGEIRSAKGDGDAGLEEWRQALALDPANFFTLIDVGKYYLMKQDPGQAAPYLDRALQQDARSSRAHHLRGLAYQASGDNAHAVGEYRLALPDGKYARSIQTFYLNFGTALVSLGLYEEAAQMLEEYCKLAPNDPDGHYQLGAAYEVLAERSVQDPFTDRVIEELKRAAALRPDHAMTHYYLSKAYRRLGLYDQANSEFELYERLSRQ
jgi:spermidine synthase